jgi:hypothetical protein
MTTNCPNFTPWQHKGKLMETCLEYFRGRCNEFLSPHEGEICPWGGMNHNPDRALVERVREMDKGNEDD